MLHEPNNLLRSAESANSLDFSFPANDHRAPGPTSPQKMRIKIAVAGVLLIVFVVVMLPRKETPAACSLSQVPPQQAALPSLNTTQLGTVAGESAQPARPSAHKVFPPIDLSTMMTRNPFAGSIQSPPPDTVVGTRETSQLAESPDVRLDTPHAPVQQPPSLQVSAIITGKGPPAALVDNRLVYVDDVVQEHWRVAAIRPTGLLLVPVRSANTP